MKGLYGIMNWWITAIGWETGGRHEWAWRKEINGFMGKSQFKPGSGFGASRC